MATSHIRPISLARADMAGTRALPSLWSLLTGVFNVFFARGLVGEK